MKAVATPNAGFGVDTFSGCGAGTTDYVTYTSAPITANCTISVTFKKIIAITGIAAEGIAVANAPVIAKCADGSGFTTKVQTGSDGKFVGYVGETALPCALQVSASASAFYYSLAQAAGTTNITLLSDLALAVASGKTAADWFVSSDWKAAVEKLPAALTQLQDALFNQGYNIPAGEFQPFTQNFQIGDSWDQLLDQIKDGAELSDYKNYAALVAAIKSDLTKLTTPTGSAKLTSEVCFNPELYADGTSLKDTSKIPNERTGIREIENLSTVIENGVALQTVKFLDTYTDSYGYVTSYESLCKRVVDQSAKRISYKSCNDRITANGELNYSSVSEMTSDNWKRFDTVKGESYTQEYSVQRQENGKSETLTREFKNVNLFKGLTKVIRMGKEYTVCEISTQTTMADVSAGGERVVHEFPASSEYIMARYGVDLTSPETTSIVLNGKQIFPATN